MINLKQALTEKIREYEGHLDNKRYESVMEHNAILVVLKELRYLNSIVEYEDTREADGPEA